MRGVFFLGVFLFGGVGFSCPNLNGKWNCRSDLGGVSPSVIVQLGDHFIFDGDADFIQEVYADGKERVVQDDTRTIWTTGSCPNEKSLKATQRQKVKDESAGYDAQISYDLLMDTAQSFYSKTLVKISFDDGSVDSQKQNLNCTKSN
ncbi:MAG: hypothetical protein COT73_13080 [Bdellovibrio sp. CG10_big_fil_rev_8_21_14_0_10_47_8]|nr:MAG: hypothetical protein COT73_13080 [Bdellovibrio sp. CG10_big_fil_rev_8_21_14_0_10_47_8]